MHTLLCAGDSNTFGSNGTDFGYVGGWPTGLYHALRLSRSDFDFIGSKINVPELLGSLPLWRLAGQAGWSIEDMTAAVQAEILASGAPEQIVDNFGTNNITAGDSLDTMIRKRISLDAAWARYAPSSRILRAAVIPFVPGTTTGANLAAWEARRQQYNAWMLANYGTSGYFALPNLGQQDIQPDGVHLNRSGQASMGSDLAAFLSDRWGAPPVDTTNVTLPRFHRQFQPQYSVNAAAAADGLTMIANNPFSPGAGSYAFAVDYYASLLDAGVLHTIAALGPYGALSSGFWLLAQQGPAVRLYWDDPAATIFGQPNELALVLNKWHRIAFVVHAASRSIGLYVNAQLVGLKQGLPAWNFPARNVYLNNGFNFTGATGYYSRVRSYVGANVPKPGSMACQLAIEGDFYLDEPLADSPPALNAVGGYYDLNGILTGLQGSPPFTVVAAAAFAPGYPAGTPLRPWEIGANYR